MLPTALKDNYNEETYQLESPFLSTYVNQGESMEGPVLEVKTASLYDMESPFLTEHIKDGEEEVVNLESEVYNELYEAIYDKEFNEAMEYLVMEAKDQYLSNNAYSNEYYNGISERVLREHFAPLARTAEGMFDKMAEEASKLDASTMTEMELEAFLNRFEPSNTGQSPAFENFLGKLWKKVKNVAGKVVDIAKKGVAFVAKFTPIGFLFNKLKALVKPLLERVLKFALNRLPAGIKPIARQLARKLFNEAEMEDVQSEYIPANQYTYEFIQNEFNQAITEIAFSNNESHQDFVVNHYVTEVEKEADTSVDAFNKAKDDFTKKLSEMKEGEDPTPELENFIPVIMGVLKIGIKIIGRQRVISFLAKLLAGLIKKFIGERPAAMLSRAVVDTAFSLLSLEMSREEEANAHWNIVTETLVDTVREVAAMPEYIFENPNLMEAFVSEAFDRAAATNFPNSMVKPEIREEASSNGAWINVPKPRYKKYTTVFNINFNLNTVKDIKTFDNMSLSQFLQSHYIVKPGQQINARMHLYMAGPGTWLNSISRSEKGVKGLWPNGWRNIHPLTREAASILLKESNLGVDMSPSHLSDRYRIFVGQRFYYLELDLPMKEVKTAPSIPSQIYIRIDPKGELKLFLYLSEGDAQEIAGLLKSGDKIKLVIKSLVKIVKSGIESLRRLKNNITIVKSGKVQSEEFVAGIMGKIGDAIIGWVVEKVLNYIWDEVEKWLKTKAREFINATEHPSSGVTIILTYKDISIPDFNLSIGSIWKNVKSVISASVPAVKCIPTEIRIVPGLKNGK